MKKLITLAVFATMIFTAGFAQTCDTLFNLQSVLDTPTYYIVTASGQNGYVSGNNSYGDLAKAEGFPALAGDSLYSALLYFAVVVINPTTADSNTVVTVAEWDNTGTSYYDIYGSPGNIIDTAQITLRQIAGVVTYANNNDQYEGVLVNFSQHVPITSDTIYVGIILPSALGDSVALYTNEVPPGPDGNGWELEAGVGNAWSSYNDDWGLAPGSLGNYIVADICGPVTPTGIATLKQSDAFSVKIFPNPANDQFNFEWNSNDQGDVSVYDVTGNLVKSFSIQGAALNTFNVQDLASGAYIIRVTDRQTNQQQSTLFTKI